MTAEHDPSSAEALFAEYLLQRATDGGLDFDAFCARHAEHAVALRRHLDDWERVQSIVERLGFTGSLTSQLRERFGEEADPSVTLEREAEGGNDFTSDVLQRLATRYGSFGRYKLKEEVARGGMGAILRVWDEDLRRNLAMKVILGEGDRPGVTPDVDSKALGRFLEEAQVTGQLDHPNIVPVHELGLDSDGRVYFTMKLVKGRTFKEIIDLVHKGEEGWTQTRALGVILKVCEAMAYAHDKGVIHRDLKPGNIMVGRFGEVYVMDWGLARVLGEEDRKDIRIRTADDEV